MKFILRISIILTFSCQGLEKLETKLENIKTIKINTDNCKEIILSEYFNMPRVVSLETYDSVLIGNPTKIQFFDNKVFVLDNARQIIWTFDKSSGKYLNKIESIGAGPGEYSFLKDFWITPELGELVVYDKAQSKLIYYTHNSNFIGEMKIDFYFQSGLALTDSIFILYSASDNTHLSKSLRNNILIYHKSKNEIINFGSFNYFEPNSFILHKNLTYSHFDDKAFVSVSFNDTIYEVSPEGVSPSIYIDFKKKIKTQHQQSKLFYEDIFNIYKIDGADYNIKNISKLNNRIYFEFGSLKDNVIRNMKAIGTDDKNEALCIKKLFDDFNGINVVNYIGNHHDEIVYLINPREINRVFQHTIKGELKEIINSKGENSNPFLYFLKPKEGISY